MVVPTQQRKWRRRKRRVGRRRMERRVLVWKGEMKRMRRMRRIEDGENPLRSGG